MKMRERRADWMKKAAERSLVCGFFVCLAVGAGAFSAQAATVSKVTVKAEQDFKIGQKRSEQDLEIDVVSDRITVESVEIQNGLFGGNDEEDVWKNDDIPVVELILSLDTEDQFSLKAADVVVKGAQYRKARLEDEQTLILQIEFPSLRLQVGEISWADWDTDHTAVWESATNAGRYELRLYRDGRMVGVSRLESDSPAYDFGEMMTQAGTYTYAVRAVNVWDSDGKSEWLYGDGQKAIDQERASELRKEYKPFVEENSGGPGGQVTAPSYGDQFGWILDDRGYWYRNPDGSWTAANWQLIEDKWYYFDSVGYRVTGWIDWNEKSYYCDPETGAMVTSTVVQDGSNRRVDSSGAWIR